MCVNVLYSTEDDSSSITVDSNPNNLSESWIIRLLIELFGPCPLKGRVPLGHSHCISRVSSCTWYLTCTFELKYISFDHKSRSVECTEILIILVIVLLSDHKGIRVVSDKLIHLHGIYVYFRVEIDILCP